MQRNICSCLENKWGRQRSEERRKKRKGMFVCMTKCSSVCVCERELAEERAGVENALASSPAAHRRQVQNIGCGF